MKNINQLAKEYVQLVLLLGEHDPNYVDAYFGPKVLLPKKEKRYKSLKTIRKQSISLFEKISSIEPVNQDNLFYFRHKALLKNIRSLIFYISMLLGEKKKFNIESENLYDTKAKKKRKSFYINILKRIDTILPGKCSIKQRFERLRKNFIVPLPNLIPVFQLAINKCKNLTKKYINLPESEHFKFELVRKKSWSAYNWYKGNYNSLIQINIDLPIYIDQILHLVSHEGYPGHHVYHIYNEQFLYLKKNWIEYSVYPLYSPRAPIAEGTANYGIELLFDEEEKISYEAEELLPKAQIKNPQIKLYCMVLKLVKQLDYFLIDIANDYLNNNIKKRDSLELLQDFLLISLEKAQKKLQFIEEYRSYIINYQWGLLLIKNFIEKQKNIKDSQFKWKMFKQLISLPVIPSMLDIIHLK